MLCMLLCFLEQYYNSNWLHIIEELDHYNIGHAQGTISFGILLKKHLYSPLTETNI